MSATAAQPCPDPKQLANLRARFALLGHELHVIGKAGQVVYEVRRWGQCRTCSTLHDLEGFLAQVGGR
jgi:hypothetical protein